MFAPLAGRLGSAAPRIVHTDMGDQLDRGNGTLGLPIGGFLIAGMDLASDETRAQTRRGYAIARPRQGDGLRRAGHAVHGAT